jgi:hypothetical protein
VTSTIENSLDFDAEANLNDYLEFKGWEPLSEGSFGRLWIQSEHRSEIAIPFGLRPGTGMWDGTIGMLADREGASRTDVDQAIRRFWTDVHDFRATSSIVQGDHIAAEAGSSLFAGAWKMLRSSATTARGPKMAIAGNYSPTGDRSIDRALFAQTRPGSYVLPLLLPIRRVLPNLDWESQVQASLLPGDFFAKNAEESEERRVSRTMAQAIAAVYNTIIKPGKNPTPSAVNEAVMAGASREMVKAIHDIVSEPSVTSLDVSFSWAPKAGQIPEGLNRVEIPNASVDLLNRAFRIMVPSKTQIRTAVSGPMLALYHPKGADRGEATIEAAYRGRVRRIVVQLRGASLLDDAHKWFRAHETLLVTGTVRPTSDGLLIDSPEDLRPIGQSMLFAEE